MTEEKKQEQSSEAYMEEVDTATEESMDYIPNLSAATEADVDLVAKDHPEPSVDKAFNGVEEVGGVDVNTKPLGDDEYYDSEYPIVD